MSEKQAYHIALPPEIHRRLRIMAAERGCSIGDIISALMRFTDARRRYGDAHFQSKFDGLLESALRNTGRVATRPGEDEKPFQADPIFDSAGDHGGKD